MSLGCSSAEAHKSSCLSEFAGKYADMRCEFCCAGGDYCNAVKSYDDISAACLSLARSAADQQLGSVCSTLLVLLVVCYMTVRR